MSRMPRKRTDRTRVQKEIAYLKKKDRRPRTIIIIDVVLFIVALVMTGVLLWLRIDWGFEEWIHEATFYNFWNGVYFIISGAILLSVTAVLGVWSVKRESVKGMVVHMVFHGLTVCLVCIGAAAMLSDAFGVEEEWVHQMIIDLMDPTNYNNNVYKDSYLGNMYSMVHCCGADGPEDYPDLFNISPPEECINRKTASELYYEDGCAEEFSQWLRIWSGTVSAVMVLAAVFEIYLIVLSYQMIRVYKGESGDSHPDPRESATFLGAHAHAAHPPTPPQRSTSVHDLTVGGWGNGQANAGGPSRRSSVRFGQVEERQIPRKTMFAREVSQQQHPPTPPGQRRRQNFDEKALPPSPKKHRGGESPAARRKRRDKMYEAGLVPSSSSTDSSEYSLRLQIAAAPEARGLQSNPGAAFPQAPPPVPPHRSTSVSEIERQRREAAMSLRRSPSAGHIPPPSPSFSRRSSLRRSGSMGDMMKRSLTEMASLPGRQQEMSRRRSRESLNRSASMSSLGGGSSYYGGGGRDRTRGSQMSLRSAASASSSRRASWSMVKQRQRRMSRSRSREVLNRSAASLRGSVDSLALDEGRERRREARRYSWNYTSAVIGGRGRSRSRSREALQQSAEDYYPDPKAKARTSSSALSNNRRPERKYEELEHRMETRGCAEGEQNKETNQTAYKTPSEEGAARSSKRSKGKQNKREDPDLIERYKSKEEEALEEDEEERHTKDHSYEQLEDLAEAQVAKSRKSRRENWNILSKRSGSKSRSRSRSVDAKHQRQADWERRMRSRSREAIAKMLPLPKDRSSNRRDNEYNHGSHQQPEPPVVEEQHHHRQNSVPSPQLQNQHYPTPPPSYRPAYSDSPQFSRTQSGRSFAGEMPVLPTLGKKAKSREELRQQRMRDRSFSREDLSFSTTGGDLRRSRSRELPDMPTMGLGRRSRSGSRDSLSYASEEWRRRRRSSGGLEAPVMGVEGRRARMRSRSHSRSREDLSIRRSWENQDQEEEFWRTQHRRQQQDKKTNYGTRNKRREEILAVPSSPSSSKRKNKNKAGSSVGEEELKKKSYENLELRFTEGNGETHVANHPRGRPLPEPNRRESGGFDPRRGHHNHHYEDPERLQEAVRVAAERIDERKKQQQRSNPTKSQSRQKRFPFLSSKEVPPSPSPSSSVSSDRSRHVRDGKTLFETNL